MFILSLKKEDFLNIPFTKTAPILATTTTGDTPTSSTPTVSSAPVSVTTTNFVTMNHNKPLPYKGNKPEDWLKHYNVIALASGWSADKKLQNIPPLFREYKKVQDWYSLAYGNKPPTNFTEFSKKFIEELSPANNDFYKFSQMNNRHQGMSEPSVDCYLSKMNLMKEYDDDMVEPMKIDIVINGSWEEIRKRVFGKPRTINELFILLKNEDFLRKDETANPLFAIFRAICTLHNIVYGATITEDHIDQLSIRT